MNDELIKYARPFPPMSDRCAADVPMCTAERSGWKCTRPAGHNGQHEAGGSAHLMFASWGGGPR